MKPKEQQGRRSLIFLRLLVAGAICLAIPLLLHGATGPAWWYNPSLTLSGTAPIISGSAMDFAAVTQGQLKNFAVTAIKELNTDLAQFGGAGATLNQLAVTLTATNAQRDDYLAVNLGQLKAITKPFYDRLLTLGYYGPPLSTGTALTSGTYPWIASGLPSNAFAMAVSGQVKWLFDFDVTHSSAGNGIPDWWVEKYFPGSTVGGVPGVDPNSAVAYTGTVTNIQAYQHGLNPTDFYAGTLPTLTAVSGSSMAPIASADESNVTVMVTDANGDPMPGAPVTFSIDYGLLLPLGASASSVAQTIQVAADANGDATVSVLAPWWPDISFTITATVQTVGQSNSVQFTGQTSDDDPAAPPTPSPSYPNTNDIHPPTLSVSISGTTASNPAFRQFQDYNPSNGQFTDSLPVQWYRTKTIYQNLYNNYINEGGPDSAAFYVETGTNNSTGTLNQDNPLSGGITWTGTSQDTDVEDEFGIDSYTANSVASQTNTGSWAGTVTWSDDVGGSGSYSIGTMTWEPWGPIESESRIESDYGFSDTYVTVVDNTTLSNQYTDQQFTSDVLFTLPSPSTWADNYDLGRTTALWELAADSSYFSVGNGMYKWKCAQTGTTPYVFEWYEVFQPDDASQPMQVTKKEWDQATQQSESPPYSVNLSSTSTNGTWYIAKLDSQTTAQYPNCRWRHVIGVGESVTLTLVGLPPVISGSATWNITPLTSGSLTSARATNFTNQFVAGENPGNVTITATFPSNIASSGSVSFSTALTIEAPTAVKVNWISEIPYGPAVPGAGMFVQYSFLPTDVSFSGCLFQEEGCPASRRSGCYQYLPIWHDPNGTGLKIPWVSPNTTWHVIQDDNTAANLDRADTGAFNITGLNLYYKWFSGGSGFSWDIPVKYKRTMDSDATAIQLGIVTQTFSITPLGAGGYTTTVNKGGIYDTQSYSPYLP